MDHINVIIVLIAALTIAVTINPIQKGAYWLILILAVVSYPVGEELLSALESATGPSSTWASYVFTASMALVFAAVGSQAAHNLKSFRGRRADRQEHNQESDA